MPQNWEGALPVRDRGRAGWGTDVVVVARFTRAGQAREPFDGERGVPAASTFQFSIAFLVHSFALSLYLLFSLLGHVVGIHDFNRTCCLQRVEGKLQVSLKVRNLQHVHASCICQVCDVIQPESKAGHESFPVDGCTAAQPSFLFWTGENLHFVSFSSSNSADATWALEALRDVCHATANRPCPSASRAWQYLCKLREAPSSNSVTARHGLRRLLLPGPREDAFGQDPQPSCVSFSARTCRADQHSHEDGPEQNSASIAMAFSNDSSHGLVYAYHCNSFIVLPQHQVSSVA